MSNIMVVRMRVERSGRYEHGLEQLSTKSIATKGYKADHRRVLEDATASLQLVLPLDIAIDYVLPFHDIRMVSKYTFGKRYGVHVEMSYITRNNYLIGIINI